MSSYSAKKSSKSQKLSDVDLGVANTVEMDINKVFTDNITSCKRININYFFS